MKTLTFLLLVFSLQTSFAQVKYQVVPLEPLAPYFEGMEYLTPPTISEWSLDYNIKFSLNSYNQKPLVIKGTQFPRTGHHLWRAMGTSQYDYIKAISAIFGDNTANIESKTFSHLKFLLMGKSSPFENLEMPGSIKRDFHWLESGIPYTQNEAIIHTKHILDNYFLNRTTQQNHKALMNYKSNSYVDWNPRAVFSTIAPIICHMYSKPILVSFKEKKLRSADLNYYNYIENGQWLQNTADTAEFLTPSHIEAEDVTAVFGINNEKITIAFMKVEFAGEIYVVGVRNPNTFCLVVSESDQTIRTCQTAEYWDNVDNTVPPVVATSTKVAANFIIKLCPTNRRCSISKDLMEKLDFKETKERLSDDFMEGLKAVGTSGKVAKVFYNSNDI